MIYNINDLEKNLSDLKVDSDEIWSIYGTGNGAELVYASLCRLKMNSSIQYIIDRDDQVGCKREFHGIPVKRLSDVCGCLSGIIIAAMDHHEIIRKRIISSLTQKQLEQIQVIDIFVYNTKEETRRYVEYIETSVLKERGEFIAFDEKGYERKNKDTKVIAWYLPQFHQIEMNNKFHGQGFTEWTNTSQAIPLFPGHYQPHIPYDVGYYDLMNMDTWKRQIYLAKHYGIYGFCIHYYWFSGTRIMEKPLELFLEHKELDMPFCLDWATENWTALWDGGNEEIMLEQSFKEEDKEKFMEDILPYMKDPRYMKINGRPILVLYRVNIFEKQQINELLNSFREIARQNGFPDLYIILTNSYYFEDDVMDWGADALTEFPPHNVCDFMEPYSPPGYLNPYFKGRILDTSSFIQNKTYMLPHNNQIVFRSALVSWDNTARKATSGGAIFQGLNPKTFKTWLKDIVRESREIHSEAENMVFVNSWNEWAEGSHLEPDMKYGYGYLQAVKEVLEDVSCES